MIENEFNIQNSKGIWRSELRDDLMPSKPVKYAWLSAVIAIALICFVLTLPIGLWLGYLWLKRRRLILEDSRLLRRAHQFLSRAKPAIAFPLKVSQAFLQPSDRIVPGWFVVFRMFEGSQLTFDDVSQIVNRLDINAGDRDPYYLDIASRIEFEPTFVLHRRMVLPASTTKGEMVFVTDLAVDALLLRKNFIAQEAPAVACLAEFVDGGATAVLPWWCLIGEEAPTKFLKKRGLQTLLSVGIDKTISR